MDKLIDLINQGGTGEYDARQPQERGEAVACQQCGQPASQIIVYTNLPHRPEQPICGACLHDFDQTAAEINDHEMSHFGGAYGLVSRELKPLHAHPTPDAGRVAELEAQLAASDRHGVYLEELTDAQVDRIAALEAQLAESREREAKLIADLDANLEAFSDERKRALSAESLARELHELLDDYVSQDSIAQGYGSGVGGTTYQKAEAFLAALAAEKEGE